MLRKLLDSQYLRFAEGTRLHRWRPAISALDAFLFESAHVTTRSPHIRDAVDLKRWMMLVVVALLPCTLMAIWNTGLQKLVYTSQSAELMRQYLTASRSFADYLSFCFAGGRWLRILQQGLGAFLPVLLVSYLVGGIWEVIFAVIRRHEVAEGFLVTGLLFPLTLPPTIPLWMVAVGVSFGVIVGKELFGGTGMNILNPALTCRLFLFFTFPAAMTGEVWVGTNPTTVAMSLRAMNEQAGKQSYDALTQATPLAIYSGAEEVKRAHVEAIATHRGVRLETTLPIVSHQFAKWKMITGHEGNLRTLSDDQLTSFVTAPVAEGGLGLHADHYTAAFQFTGLQYGLGKESAGNLFWGNRTGSMGETSTFAILLGAFLLLWLGLTSWRIMLAMALGAYLTALLFQLGAHFLGVDAGAWNPARFAFPAYKQLIMGSLAFGIVFMATDPVSSPSMAGAKWAYGVLAGMLTILIRTVNPAYPEGTMLAILFANVFAPLFDSVAIRLYRKRRLRIATT